MTISDKTSRGGKRKRDESGPGVSPSIASRPRFNSTGTGTGTDTGSLPVPDSVRTMQAKQDDQKGKRVVETAALDELQGEKRDMPDPDECLRLRSRFGSVASGSGFTTEAGAAEVSSQDADFAAIIAWGQAFWRKDGEVVETEIPDGEVPALFWKSLSCSWVPAHSKMAVIAFPTRARRLQPRPRHILSESSEEEEDDDGLGLPAACEEKGAPASVTAEEVKVAPVVRLLSASPLPEKKSVRGKRQRNVDTSDDDWEKDEIKRKRARRKEARNQPKEVTEKRADRAKKVTVKRTRKLHTPTNAEDGKASRMCDMCRRNNGEEVVYCQECKFHLCFACLDCHISGTKVF